MSLSWYLRATVWFVAIATYAQADEPSTSEIESAVRAYRIRTYNAHRLDRQRYDQLIEQSDKLLRRHNDGELSGQELLNWLRPTKPRSPVRMPPVEVESPLVHRRPIDPESSRGTALTKPPAVSPRIEPDSPPTSQPITSPPPTIVGSDSTLPLPSPQANKPATQTVSSKTKVSVNTTVLSARIESTNLRLETIEAQLNRDAQRLFPDELEALVFELEELIDRQDMSATYFEILSDAERSSVASLVSPRPIITLLVRRLFEAQIVAHERASASGLPEDRTTLDLLQDLTQKVKSWQNH